MELLVVSVLCWDASLLHLVCTLSVLIAGVNFKLFWSAAFELGDEVKNK
jgi:hypothetical protein